MRVTCERCGQERMFSEVHSAQRAMPVRDILRQDATGRLRRADRKAELVSGIESASSRPVPTILLRAG
jgi:hypothetical protein